MYLSIIQKTLKPISMKLILAKQDVVSFNNIFARNDWCRYERFGWVGDFLSFKVLFLNNVFIYSDHPAFLANRKGYKAKNCCLPMEKSYWNICGMLLFGSFLVLDQVLLFRNNVHSWWRVLVDIAVILIFADYCYKYGKYKGATEKSLKDEKVSK